MPRIAHSLLKRASKIDRNLPRLLRASAGELAPAKAELHWLKEHALSTVASVRSSEALASQVLGWRTLVHRYCLAREKGVPLQYIMGSQPFGDLEILCRPKVLIPRPETESTTLYLASLLRSGLTSSKVVDDTLMISDLCTGTGCIALLLYSELKRHVTHGLLIQGIDISDIAVRLARRNVQHNVQLRHVPETAMKDISFTRGNVLESAMPGDCIAKCDVFTANPPYISSQGFKSETSRSVRNYEPRLALVPSLPVACAGGVHDGDVFYTALLWRARDSRAKVVMLEVADLRQARRVVKMAKAHDYWAGLEIWRDRPEMEANELRDSDRADIESDDVLVKGQGHGRAVVCWSADGARLLGKA